MSDTADPVRGTEGNDKAKEIEELRDVDRCLVRCPVADNDPVVDHNESRKYYTD